MNMTNMTEPKAHLKKVDYWPQSKTCELFHYLTGSPPEAACRDEDFIVTEEGLRSRTMPHWLSACGDPGSIVQDLAASAAVRRAAMRFAAMHEKAPDAYEKAAASLVESRLRMIIAPSGLYDVRHHMQMAIVEKAMLLNGNVDVLVQYLRKMKTGAENLLKMSDADMSAMSAKDDKALKKDLRKIGAGLLDLGPKDPVLRTFLQAIKILDNDSNIEPYRALRTSTRLGLIRRIMHKVAANFIGIARDEKALSILCTVCTTAIGQLGGGSESARDANVCRFRDVILFMASKNPPNPFRDVYFGMTDLDDADVHRFFVKAIAMGTEIVEIVEERESKRPRVVDPLVRQPKVRLHEVIDPQGGKWRCHKLFQVRDRHSEDAKTIPLGGGETVTVPQFTLFVDDGMTKLFVELRNARSVDGKEIKPIIMIRRLSDEASAVAIGNCVSRSDFKAVMRLFAAMTNDTTMNDELVSSLLTNICKVTSSCCCCGRDITSGKSVADGIGPVCRKRYGRFLSHQVPLVAAANAAFIGEKADATTTARNVLETLRKLDPASDSMISTTLEMLSGDMDQTVALMASNGLVRADATVDDVMQALHDVHACVATECAWVPPEPARHGKMLSIARHIVTDATYQRIMRATRVDVLTDTLMCDVWWA